MNIPRLFVERRHIAWVALVATLIWGVTAYGRMPQRKDPEVVIKTAVVTVPWPGAAAEDIENLVTRPVERVAGQVPRVDRITSTTRAGIATVFVTLEDTARRADLEPAWSDLRARLDLLRGTLPAGAGMPQLNTHFGDTATVTYSVASPPVSDMELDVRAAAIRRALEGHRAARAQPGTRAATVFIPAEGIARETVARAADRYLARGRELGALRDGAVLWGASFVALDYQPVDEAALARLDPAFWAEELGGEVPHPDVWGPISIRDISDIRPRLAAAAGDKYSHRELDEFTTHLRDEIARLPEVGRVDRHGVVPEKVYLLYSQEKLASFGLHPRQIGEALRAHNINVPGGSVSTGRQTLLVEPSGAFSGLNEILDTVVASARDGSPLFVRDVVEVHRTYETPITDASWLTWRDARGWHKGRSVAVAVQAKSGVQAVKVGEQVDELVKRMGDQLPADLVIAKTSDQPELVEHKISEFMRSLAEAIAIVIAIALLFMERRSALLVAASIPLTLAMTFGFMDLFGLDLQQVSIASLIIALGLLVDDPVIASDAINREIAAGVPRERAAWQGPTRLAKAILFATITNVVAFAPLLLVKGTMGDFIYSLPMVVSLSLISSRIVSMTFMPLLGYHLLRGQKGYEAALEGGGPGAEIARKYNAVTEWILAHKARSFLGFVAFLLLGLAPAVLIKAQFFPEEAMSRFYVHVRLPEGSDVRATEQMAEQARRFLLRTEGDQLERITSFVGNGGPRWWSNVSPDPKNPAYALMIVQTRDAEHSKAMIGRVQATLRSSVPGARFEVYRISSGKPAVMPVEVRVSGPDPTALRGLAEQVKDVLRAEPLTADVTDDWGAETLKLTIDVDDGRASAAGFTHADIASSAQAGFSGSPVTQLRERDRLVDVVLRLRPGERGAAAQVKDLYVWSSRSGRSVPVQQVADIGRRFQAPKIVRYNQERTITVGAIPLDGALPSSLLAAVREPLARIALAPGHRFELGGEQEQQARAFASVSIALKTSILLIFLVLVWQFAHFFKPFIVFASIPFGLVGVVLGLVLTGTHFGFMAFLGVASLVGVVVSHIIVLFDFIEEAREHGVELHRAVIDAGLVRLRPVLVTVLATVGGLVPLALEGGPMWRQLVYVQIGGLLLATVVTKGVVPLLYVVFVETLKVVAWKRTAPDGEH
ncbi:MAG: efflux RND transporter permease subunit [Deltaproteobacteria bacterium]|nr:efflux RND transporter permease subunit [Deltaproteobacteria bacterium]